MISTGTVLLASTCIVTEPITSVAKAPWPRFCRQRRG